jgi:hypothetical protein
MEIVFDDSGSKVAPDGTVIIVDGYNTIAIDGDNMLVFFPNEEARFKFAAEVKRKAATGQQNTK